MINDSETVECQIDDAAIDKLAGVKGTLITAIDLLPCHSATATCRTSPR